MASSDENKLLKRLDSGCQHWDQHQVADLVRRLYAENTRLRGELAETKAVAKMALSRMLQLAASSEEERNES